MRIPVLKPVIRAINTRIAPLPPKETDQHYGSAEHRKWRLEVMHRAGWRCQWPGCSRASPVHRLYADHVVEIADGGAKLDPANGMVLCAEHHSKKTNREREKRRKAESAPER